MKWVDIISNNTMMKALSRKKYTFNLFLEIQNYNYSKINWSRSLDKLNLSYYRCYTFQFCKKRFRLILDIIYVENNFCIMKIAYFFIYKWIAQHVHVVIVTNLIYTNTYTVLYLEFFCPSSDVHSFAPPYRDRVQFRVHMTFCIV